MITPIKARSANAKTSVDVIQQTQIQNELKKIEKGKREITRTRLLETRSHSEALHTNSKRVAFSEHNPHLTRRAKRTNQPSRHPSMSQLPLKQLSAVYERPIKVGMNTPPKRQTKATQVEQQATRATRCTKPQVRQRHPSMSQLKQKQKNGQEPIPNFDPLRST